MEQSNRLQLHNFSSSSHINWSKYETKSYLHFDNRVKIEHVKKSIQDPEWIFLHAFSPFIHFEIKFEKYVVKDLPNINQLKKVALPKDLKEKKIKLGKYITLHI
ncbi:hypothetical protein [Bacillus thuringiensis]|uniref:hypothetical protein n=1 Tax=Bacillus thuringiensis TaxID=1428 RepID=UPI001CB9464B|nr:hypothetical protein [Bacillus thuringiensis]